MVLLFCGAFISIFTLSVSIYTDIDDTQKLKRAHVTPRIDNVIAKVI